MLTIIVEPGKLLVAVPPAVRFVRKATLTDSMPVGELVAVTTGSWIR